MCALSQAKHQPDRARFRVTNFEEKSSQDINALQELQRALASLGAVPVRVDFPTQELVVEITAPDLAMDQILNLIRAHGYAAEPWR